MSAVKLLTICFILCVSVYAEEEAQQGEDFNGEFFQGMETGFFLRDTPQGYRDYECPDLPIDRSIQDTLQKFFVPIEMLLGLLNDDSIK